MGSPTQWPGKVSVRMILTRVPVAQEWERCVCVYREGG